MNKLFRLLWDNNIPDKRLNPMDVNQILQFPSGGSFPICPACKITLEREYQKYCDRCGQCLNWQRFDNATVVIWNERSESVLGEKSHKRYLN